MQNHRIFLLLAACTSAMIGLILTNNLLSSPLKIDEIKDVALLKPAAPASVQAEASPNQARSEPTPESLFNDETFLRGILHKHSQKKTAIQSLEDTLGSGVCVFDFNNDGWEDIFFVTGAGNLRHFGSKTWWGKPQTNTLYLNMQGQYFKDISNEVGIRDVDFGTACAADDLDKDGYVDLVIANKNGNILYKNDTGKKLVKIDKAFPETSNSFSTAIKIIDLNNDGLKDIIFGNYINFKQEQNVLELNSGYENKSKSNYDSSLYDAQSDQIYVNQGEMAYTLGNLLTDNNKHGRTLGFVNINHTLVALNDKGSPSQIVYQDKNAPSGTINNLKLNAKDATQVITPSANAKKLLIGSDASKSGLFAINLDADDFNDNSWDYNINTETTLSLNSWAVLVADFNGDGVNDIFAANGTSIPHPDTNMTTAGQPNLLLIANSSTQKFDRINFDRERVLSSRGAAYGDFNNDGALDIVINNNNDFASLLLNQHAPKNWVGLRCIPTYLCENSKLSIEGKVLVDAFQYHTHFESQSGNGVVTLLEKSNLEGVSVAIESEHGAVFGRLQKSNRYYLIDLMSKNITEITAGKETKQNTRTAVEEYLLKIKEGSYDDRAAFLTSQLPEVDDENKIKIINQIQKSTSWEFFPLVDYWSQRAKKPIALKSIALLSQMEREESVPTLITLLNSSDEEISCAASHAFEHYYWKDEAVIEHKKWAIAPLIALLDKANGRIQQCASNALAESESYRALQPMLKLLKSDDPLVVSSAVHALGMIRQSQATPMLKELLHTSKSAIVKAECVIALTRLSEAGNIDVNQMVELRNPISRAIFFSVINKVDDGVIVERLQSIKANMSKGELYDTYKNLPVETLDQLERQIGKSTDLSNTIRSFLVANVRDAHAFHTPLDSVFWEQFNHLSIDDQSAISENFTIKDLAVLARNNPKFLPALCSKDAHINKEKSLYCNARSTPLKGSTDELALQFRALLNSGLYLKAYAHCAVLSEKQDYLLANALLMKDKALAASDKVRFIANCPFNENILPQISELSTQSNADDQIAITDSIVSNLPKETAYSWLINQARTTKIDAVKYHIDGLAIDLKGK